MKRKVEKTRLNLLIDADLKVWARKYAKKKHTTITQMIVDHFVKLRESK
jgi:hypothetical protein